jgi:hypothetical protein
MPTPSTGPFDKTKIAQLLALFESLEAKGAASNSHADHDKRNNTLDELQDLVGMAGKMVMDSDIVRRAKKILADR